MGTDPKEQARLEKIRQQQIAARHPGASKIKGYDWSKHNKRSKEIAKSRQKPLWRELYELLPMRWRGAIIGIVFGLIVSAFLVVVVLSPDLVFLALIPPLIGGIVGMVVGKTLQDDPIK